MKELKETKICYPTVETWFICWGNIITQTLNTDKDSEFYNDMISVETEDKEIKAYGSIEPTQCMESPYDIVDYYTVEAEWIAVLLENGINPFPDEETEKLIK